MSHLTRAAPERDVSAPIYCAVAGMCRATSVTFWSSAACPGP